MLKWVRHVERIAKERIIQKVYSSEEEGINLGKTRKWM